MTDPVYAADVLDHAEDAWWSDWPHRDTVGTALTDALLAYGDGDPVVIMPDKMLRRLVPSKFVPGHYYLTDPVVPE